MVEQSVHGKEPSKTLRPFWSQMYVSKLHAILLRLKLEDMKQRKKRIFQQKSSKGPEASTSNPH